MREVWTAPAMLCRRGELSPNSPAQWSKSHSGDSWQPTSWSSYLESARCIAKGLRCLGLQPGHRVGIMLPTSPAWDELQLGILFAGGVVTGLDCADVDTNLNTIARACRFSGLIIPNASSLARFDDEARKNLTFIVYHETSSDTSISGLGASTYANLKQTRLDQFEEPPHLPAPDDPATIIFTSGTTGTPKGIAYSHRQLCLAVKSISEAFSAIDANTKLACWMPLANLFQRILNFLAVYQGAETYYVLDPAEILPQMNSINPHIFIGVPRFYEKLYAAIEATVSNSSQPKKMLLRWALQVGDRHSALVRSGSPISSLLAWQHHLADRLVLGRLRSIMGSNLRYMISGSAPMPLWLLERFHGLGLLVCEAYGMSENVIPNACNTPQSFRFGTVGHPLRGCEIRIAADGELLVRGPGVVDHYLNETTPLKDEYGFMPSGDFAEIDADGFISLKGRKSEIFKTATGRRVAPAATEAILKKAPNVEFAVVTGEGRPFVAAILVAPGIRTEELRHYGEELQHSLRSSLKALPEHQIPGGLIVTNRPFTVESGELTPNLKLRRQFISEEFAPAVDKLYLHIQQAAGTTQIEMLEEGGRGVALCRL